MDYNINGNDVVQMMTIDVKDMPSTSKTKPSQTFKEPSQPHQSTEQNDYQSAVSVESQYYKVGDLVDYLDNYRGCWYEGIITKIIKADKEPSSAFLSEPSISFVIRSDRC